jgi:tetratricopeptide (TPR) repeat protein
VQATSRSAHPVCARARLARLLCGLALAGLLLTPAWAGEGKDDAGAKKDKPTYGTRAGSGVSRQGMWPAPTAEDWAKPCLITFQRTWEDAVSVSRETGKPILCCINMDGEIASEHYAGVRWRDPAIAQLFKPYVCVVASVYRHNPRDYDDQGHRILCPRFGSVTCGEHIAMERVIFRKYMDGKRISPRYIMVDLQGKEVFDIYYKQDTASVFDAIRDGPEKVPPPKPEIVRGDRPLLERVASRHVVDREAVEKAWREGDHALRQQILDAARKHPEAAPLQIYRLAAMGLDADLGKAAREALAASKSAAAAPLIADVLQGPMQPSERDKLLAALKRLGQDSPLARWLAGVHQGLSGRSSAIDPSTWIKEHQDGTYPAPPEPKDPLSLRAEEMARQAYEHPEDPGPRLAYAEASLEQALQTRRTYLANPNFGRRMARALYAEAIRSGHQAEKLGATGWRVNAVLALASYYSGDLKEGYARAEKAMKFLPPGDATWVSMAVVTVFAESRWKAIKKAVREKKDWPPEWLADIHSAYTVLRNHPLGTDSQVVWHYNLLMWLGARRKAVRVLEDGIKRFRDSEALHRLLRERLLRWRGPKGLEEAYDHMLAEQKDPVHLEAFAGLASLEAADQYRRVHAYAFARDAYGRAIDHYQKAIEAWEGHKPGADVAIALALAARARVEYELDDDAAALKDILASYARSPGTAATRDGLGFSPIDTGQMLMERLDKAGNADGVAQIKQAFSKLDPEFLKPDLR